MPSTEVQEKVWKARDAVLALVKVMKTASIFPREHPQYKKALEDFTGALNAYTDRYGALKFQTSPEAFFLEGTEVYAWEQGLPFRLYMDGVREISFHPQLEAGEIDRFLKIVERDPGASGEEEDIVSLFWKEGFKGITYFAVDELYADYLGYSDEEETDVDPKTKERREQIRDILSGLSAPGPSGSRMRFEIPDLPEDFASTAAAAARGEAGIEADRAKPAEPEVAVFDVSNEEKETLRREIAGFGVADLVPRAIDIAYAVLDASPDEESRSDVQGFLATLYEAAVEQGDFPTMIQFLDRMKEINAANPGGMAQGLTDAFIAYLSTDDQVRRVLGVIEKKYIGGAEGIYKYFFHLDPCALKPIAAAYPSLLEKNARRAIRDLLLARAKENLEAISSLVISTNPATVRDGLYILGQIEDESALEPLAKALRVPDESVREYAIWLVSKIPGDGRQELLLKALRDPSEKMRLTTLRYMKETGDPGFVGPLLRVMRERGFRALSQDEIAAWADAAAALGGPAVAPELEAIAGKGKFFEKRHTRVFRRILKDAARAIRPAEEAP